LSQHGDTRHDRLYREGMLFTIGHSTRSLDELVAMLRAHEVQWLVDIRRFPRSRTNPQFNGEALTSTLPAGIRYTYLQALGGRRGKSGIDPACNAGWQVAAFHHYADYALTPPFRTGLRALLALAADAPCAIMCAEAVWWRCHRRIVTDYVLAHGSEVTHLLSLSKAEPAKLTPFARVDGEDVYYPAG
jgi:uncharacterized protein (DUF488 family)